MGGCYFAGANTEQGFCGCFAEIPKGYEENKHTIILKGGPGCGKSTLMKRIAEAADQRGMQCERYYCSGDPDSLDAVWIPDKNRLILDGTAPHAVEPEAIGVVEEIVNLGEWIRTEELTAQKKEITALVREKKRYYEQAYAMLKAAGSIHEERQKRIAEALDGASFEKYIDTIFTKEEEAGEKTRADMRNIKERNLFWRAITWKGVICLEGKKCSQQKRIFFHGEAAEQVVGRLKKESENQKKICPESYRHPLCPQYCDGFWYEAREGEEVLIGNADCILDATAQQVDADYFLMEDIFKENLRLKKLEEELLLLAREKLGVCRSLHQALEEQYIRHISFEKITEKTNQMMDQIINM